MVEACACPGGKLALTHRSPSEISALRSINGAARKTHGTVSRYATSVRHGSFHAPFLNRLCGLRQGTFSTLPGCPPTFVVTAQGDRLAHIGPSRRGPFGFVSQNRFSNAKPGQFVRQNGPNRVRFAKTPPRPSRPAAPTPFRSVKSPVRPAR